MHSEDPWARLRVSVGQFAEAFNTTLDRLDHVLAEAERFGKEGWPLDPSLDMNELAWLVDASSAAPLDEVFIALYEGEEGVRLGALFSELVASVRLVRWRPIVVQARNAFDQHHYALMVPALVTILEGVFFQTPSSGRDVRKVVSAILAEQPDNSFSRVAWQTVVDFISDIFAHSDFAGEEPRMNRHWVLHGRAVAEWNREDVIRLLHGIRTIDRLHARVV